MSEVMCESFELFESRRLVVSLMQLFSHCILSQLCRAHSRDSLSLSLSLSLSVMISELSQATTSVIRHDVTDAAAFPFFKWKSVRFSTASQ